MRFWIAKGSPSNFNLPEKLFTSTPFFFRVRFLPFNKAANCLRVVVR